MNFVKSAFAATAAIAALSTAPAIAQTVSSGYSVQPQYYGYGSPAPTAYGYQNTYSPYANQNGHYVYQNGQWVWQSNIYAAPTQYGYQQPYANAYGYNQGYNNRMQRTSAATQQCSAAVQNKLRTKQGLASTIASLVGVGTNARVVSLNPATRIKGEKGALRVTGLASSGNFGPYGVGAYGATGYSSQADLSFTCDTNRYGRVTNVTVTKL